MVRTWDADRAILHADLDCFFASVEVLDDPALKGLPVVVGGTGPRGVVAAASYEARVWGVGSAMAMSKARRLCPHGVFLDVSYRRYSEASQEFHAILQRFTDRIESVGLDEAFIDVSGCAGLFGPPQVIASEIRRLVRRELGLAVSVGVGTTKQIAKLASRRAKPSVANGAVHPAEGVVVVWPDDVREFLDPIAVSELWGVGPKTYQRLRSIGVERVADLRSVPEVSLSRAVGKASSRLRLLADGTDADPVRSRSPRKSIGRERTYPIDLYELEEIDRELVRLADDVADRVARQKVVGRTITLKVRFDDFRTITRSVTIASPTSSRTTILASLRKLVPDDASRTGVRLLGVALSSLTPEGPIQLTLDSEESDARESALSRSVEQIRERFGTSAISPASTMRGTNR